VDHAQLLQCLVKDCLSQTGRAAQFWVPYCRVFEYLLQRPPSIGGAVKKLLAIFISHSGAYFFNYFL